jgi:GNAT superfamily N-acetyltransferase
MRGDDPMPTFRPYQRGDLRAVIGLCQLEAWPSFPADPERAHRAMTAPGVTTMVAMDGAAGVVGFACLQSDGEIQAHLSLIAVHPGHRRRGIARALIGEALRVAGGERIDLVTDSAEGFYASLAHRRMAGFRIYPNLRPGRAGGDRSSPDPPGRGGRPGLGGRGPDRALGRAGDRQPGPNP